MIGPEFLYTMSVAKQRTAQQHAVAERHRREQRRQRPPRAGRRYLVMRRITRLVRAA
ncbi:hypothetical protein [Nitriliruptor alkaliphilus]|uniref:hypothetical protein n=1 Tax=Nitriliruptor alkaliphilus TaxID=427918 RepID=UPI0012ECF426|nr:hypothetical protein [Nitriliruptor alkaliphilus]